MIEFVDVSPNGQQVAVSSDRRGNQDLWVLPATGGEMTALTTDPTPDWNPRWSPDGSQIASTRIGAGIGHLGDAGAGRSGTAAHESPRHRLVPELVTGRWPRDCLRILPRWRGRHLDRRRDGGEPRRVTMGAVDWSPDGQWLAGLRQGKVFRIPKDGGDLVPSVHRLSRADLGSGVP